MLEKIDCRRMSMGVWTNSGIIGYGWAKLAAWAVTVLSDYERRGGRRTRPPITVVTMGVGFAISVASSSGECCGIAPN